MVTQIGFVRVSSHPAVNHYVSTQEALEKLFEIVGIPGHSFWPEPTDGYANKVFFNTIPDTLTHGQVTDGYLSTVAFINHGILATLDRRLSQTFDKLSVLVAADT